MEVQLRVAHIHSQQTVPSVEQNLKRHGCARTGKSSKVQGLNTGIKTDKLNTPKAQIMSTHAPQDNFDVAVGLCQDFIAQSKPNNKNNKFIVSGFEGGGGGVGGSGVRGGGGRGGSGRG
jgi:hypothetical protein